MSTKMRDLTEFFLEWRETCAIDECKKSLERGDVQEVNKMYDKCLADMIKNARESSLGKGVKSVSEFSGITVNAFKLIESEFYTPGKKPMEEGGKNYGESLKNHLFESADTKNCAGRLNGYFFMMLRSIVNNSFKKSVVNEPVATREDEDTDDFTSPIDRATAPGTMPGESLIQSECHADFTRLCEEFWKTAPKDIRLAFLCDVFEVSKSTPQIVQASGLKQSAFYNRKPLAKEIRDICCRLHENGYEFSDIEDACVCCLPDLAKKFGLDDPQCRFFFNIQDDLKHGKNFAE